jgi:hypothetical protein
MQTLSGGNQFRAQVEQEQRRVLADQRGLTGTVRERYIITGEFNPTEGESGSRTEFTRDTRDQREVMTRWGDMVRGSQQRTGAGDIAIVYSYMRMLDPNSTVRGHEEASASNAAGVPEGIRGLWNRVVGGGRLSDESRAQILQAAAPIANQAHKQTLTRAEYMQGVARRTGYNPENVTGPIPAPMEIPEMFRRATPQPGQQTTREPPGAPPDIGWRRAQ